VKKKFFALSIFFLVFLVAHAQDNDPIIETDTLNVKKKVQVIGIPILYYTPETSLGFGVGAQFFLANQRNIYNSRQSNILVSFVYTLNKQYIIEVYPKIYFQFGNWMLDGVFKYKLFPNTFWGIGNETPNSNQEKYTMESLEFSGAFLKRLPPSMNFGLEYRYENFKILEKKSGGLLNTAGVIGANGAVTSGIYIVFNLDDRDNIFSATKGNFMQINAGFSSRVLGSSNSFNKFVIDLRKYTTWIKNHVIAAQIYLEDNYGNVPFQDMGFIGGNMRNRGYFKGRYIDNHLLALQIENRWHFMDRWILTAFLSSGEVSKLPWDFFDDLKISYGGGLRFQIIKSKPTLLRFDVGFDEAFQPGFYVGVNEAF